MRRLKKTLFALVSLTVPFVAGAGLTDTIPSGFSRPLEWRIGGEISPAYVMPTNRFLRGDNPEQRYIQGNFSGSLRADFSFSGDSKEGMLYKGTYQGVGIGGETFFSNSLLGTPFTAYVFQGAPIVNFSRRWWLGYEWKFGAAIGWKHYDKETADDNVVASTSATALMGLGLHLHYSLSDRWDISLGIEARHYSNGNTSLPNSGANTVGGSIGFAYVLNPLPKTGAVAHELEEEADRGGWLYDIMVFGAWRKRIVNVGNYTPEPQLVPGKFGVFGFQFSPMRSLNRYVAVGPALDVQWDESAGLEDYWVEGTTDDYIKFYRPSFWKQLSAGVSAHAELTMPIFCVNVGFGYDFINPKGDKRFYQSLTLKTFVTKHLFLNVGYRLGDFKDPQNLMLGVGVRL